MVDDGSEDETREIVERYMVHDERLHLTFVPYGARVGSTKKLALTLAAKAAKYDFLLLTDADCVAESNLWIRAMMQGFAPDKDIVLLGFSPYFAEKGHINRLGALRHALQRPALYGSCPLRTSVYGRGT